MTRYRSAQVTTDPGTAVTRSLWRATGMTDADFGKPIIAVANSFTEFVPGHVDRKSTRLNSSHIQKSRMPSSA